MATLELRFLGEFSVLRDGQAQPLPPSKKTRALLAYLSMSGRQQRREHLCELLWEIPDDPRGSLRWSLSKLRRLLDDDDRERILADRGHIQLDLRGASIDAATLQSLAASDLAQTPTAVLEETAARYAGNFLEGLEFSDFHDFHAWCIAERERTSLARASVLRELVRRLSDVPERALAPARALVCLAPYDEAARADLIRLLLAARHMEEADQQFQLGMRMLKEAGLVSTGALLAARQEGLRGGGEARAEPAQANPPAPHVAPQERKLVGRREEQTALTEAWATAAAGRTLAVLLRGEPGVGKSCLLEWIGACAKEEAGLHLAASASETDQIRPFALWIDALRTSQPEAAERIFSDGRAENRESLFARLSEIVVGTGAPRPAAILFDDVHWVDESSVAALHYVLRAQRKRPVLAVLAARESELRDNVALQQALRGLRRDGLLRELRLGPLSPEEIDALIQNRATGAGGSRLGRDCGGNPLLALELARAESRGGGAGADSFDGLVRERLARFSMEGADVLRWAAVLGTTVNVPDLLSLTGVSGAALGAALEEAERQAILVSGEGGLRFAHDLVARAIYTEISPVRRQMMHRRVAEWLEQDTTHELTRAAALAHHAGLSGDPALAARALVSAGRLCLRFFANQDALNLARRGLQLAEQLPAAERVRVTIDLHDVMLVAAPLDDWEGAADQFTGLAEQALDVGAPAHARRAYNMAAYVRWQHGQWADAREQSLQSERAVRGSGDREHIVGLAETAKCLVMLERDLAQADAMAMEAQALAQRGQFAHNAIPAALGMLRFFENRMDEAEELLKQARTLCKWAGDRINEYQADEYLVMVDIQRGRHAAAKVRCMELVALGDKLREGSEAPFAHALLGLCAYALEDDPKALDAALEDLPAADAKHRLAYAQTRAAMLDCQRGRHDTGAARAREALACAEILERCTEMLLAHAVLAQCCRAEGETADAQRHAEEVVRLHGAGVAAWADDIVRRVTGKECLRHG